MNINKNMTIGEVLKISKNAEKVLMSIGMHCVFCPSSQMETIEQAAMVHSVDVDYLINLLENE